MKNKASVKVYSASVKDGDLVTINLNEVKDMVASTADVGDLLLMTYTKPGCRKPDYQVWRVNRKGTAVTRCPSWLSSNFAWHYRRTVESNLNPTWLTWHYSHFSAVRPLSR